MTTTTARPTKATLEGVTIEIIEFTDADWRVTFQVALTAPTASGQGTPHRRFVPIPALRSEGEARKVANRAWHAIRGGVGAHQPPAFRLSAIARYAAN